MNSLIKNDYPGIHDLRDQLMDMISDPDLRYKLPGHNPTLGELCEEMGQTQQIYTLSFRTLTQDWKHRGTGPESAYSVASLRAWFKKLEADLYEAVNGLLEDDLHSKHIDRGHGFNPTLYIQFQVYREALLIFYAKASVYLKALEKPVTDQWKSWIG